MVRKKTVQRSLFLEFREPWQRGLAVALGLTLGLLPKFNLIFAALLLITLVSPVSLVICCAVGCVASLISPQLAGIEHWLGSWVLGHSKLQVLWETLFSSSVFRAIGFQNSQVMGSLILGLGCFYPTYLASTFYFQRRRQLHLDGLFTLQTAVAEKNQPTVESVAVESTLPQTAMDKVGVDTVLSQRAEVIVPGAESLMTAHLLTLPALNPTDPVSAGHTVTSETVTSETVTGAVTETMTSSIPTQLNSTPSTPPELIHSEADIAEAERILHDLVSAKQWELHQQTLEGRAAISRQEIEEQQWVLDTLIEIIRLKDEAVKGQDAHAPSADTVTNKNTLSNTSNNLLAPLASATESDFNTTHKSSNSESDVADNNSSNQLNHVSENSMDKLTRTDSGVSSSGVNAIGSSEQVDRMSSAAPSPVNVVPHSARPRSMHTRDESLRFLIHHLQCLQRERGE
jgi:uncharacterized protein (TIGR03546 family)